MTQSNPLERAKQGDPTAIAALMNRSLHAKGIHATVDRAGDRLQINLGSDQPLNRLALVGFVRAGLKNLALTAVKSATIVGKTAEHQTWQETIELDLPKTIAVPEESTSLSARPLPPPPPSTSEPALAADHRQFPTLAPGEVPASPEDLPLSSRSLAEPTVFSSGFFTSEEAVTALPEPVESQPLPSARFAEWQPAAVAADRAMPPSSTPSSGDFYLDETDEVVETTSQPDAWLPDTPTDAVEGESDLPNDETSLVPVEDQSSYPSESSDLVSSDSLLLDRPIDLPEPTRRSDWLSFGGFLAALTIGLVAAIIGYSLWLALDPSAPLPNLVPSSPNNSAEPDANPPSPQ